MIDITAYGAGPGKSGAENHTAIQQAINDAAEARSTLYIPGGVYDLQGTGLLLQEGDGTPADGLIVQGDGPTSVLRMTGHIANVLRGEGSSRVTCRDFALDVGPSGSYYRGVWLADGSHYAVERLNCTGQVSGGNPSAAVVIGRATDARVVDCFVPDGGGQGIRLNLVTRCRVRGNTLVGVTSKPLIGLALVDCMYAHVTGNHVEGVKCDDDHQLGYGIMLYRNVAASSEGHHVTENTVLGTEGTGIYVQGCPLSIVEGNIADDVVDDQQGSLAMGGVVSTLGPGVVGLNLVRSSSRHGVYARSDETTGDAPMAVVGNAAEDIEEYGVLADVSNGAVVGNAMRDVIGGVRTGAKRKNTAIVGNSVAGRGTAVERGVHLKEASEMAVVGNAIEGVGGPGVTIDLKSRRNLVLGNIAKDCGAQGSQPTTRAGIVSSGGDAAASDNLTVSNAVEGVVEYSGSPGGNEYNHNKDVD